MHDGVQSFQGSGRLEPLPQGADRVGVGQVECLDRYRSGVRTGTQLFADTPLPVRLQALRDEDQVMIRGELVRARQSDPAATARDQDETARSRLSR